MSELPVDLRNAVVLLGGFPALTGVNLSVNAGEKVLISGPNGAGKTTLLKTCAGLCSLYSGEGQVFGANLKSRPAVLRQSLKRVGFLGEKNMLYDALTVKENVVFWSRLAGGTENPTAALEKMQISPELWNRQTVKLSTGQRRKAAMAVFITRRPSLWLLDEPYVGLDRQARNLLDEIITEAVSLGATLVMTSHEKSGLEKSAPEKSGDGGFMDGFLDREVKIAGGTNAEADETK